MKISTKQLAELQPLETHQKKPTDGDGFKVLFTEQLHSQRNQEAAPLDTTLPEQKTSPLERMDALTIPLPSTDRQGNPLQADVMLRMDTILTGLDEFSRLLAGHNSASLREAYGALEHLSAEVASLKSDHPDLAAQPALASLVNELNILTSVEQFKFNRGDYS